MTAPVKTRKTEKPHPFYGKKLNLGVIRGFTFTFARDTYPSPSIIPYIFRYVKFYITFLYFLYESGIFLEEIYVGFFSWKKFDFGKNLRVSPFPYPKEPPKHPLYGAESKNFRGLLHLGHTFRTYI